MLNHLCILLHLCMGDITGPATVVDGDTIKIDAHSIRLQGVDAEELSESKGHAAKSVMEQVVKGKVVVCKPDGTMSYRRIVASCFVDGLDVAIPLIASGSALDCPRYSKGRYSAYEPPGAREHLLQKDYCR